MSKNVCLCFDRGKKKKCSHSQSHKSKTVISLRVFVFLIRASLDRVILVRVSNRVLCQKEYKTFIFSGMFFLFFFVWQFKSPRAICRRWKNNFCRCLAPSARTAVNLQSDTICDEVLACCICHLFSICLWLLDTDSVYMSKCAWVLEILCLWEPVWV